jgi:hypothetical protein
MRIPLIVFALLITPAEAASVKRYAPGYKFEYTSKDLQALMRQKYIPPAKYDHAFDGPLVVIEWGTPQETADKCGLKPSVPSNHIVGCAWPAAVSPIPGSCVILHAYEKDLERFGLTVNGVLRHEIAHCNGWPSDHSE